MWRWACQRCVCVGVRQPAEESGEFTLVLGPNYEVPMIRHQAVSDEPNRMPVEGFEQDAFESVVIAIFVEKPLPGDAAIEGVVDVASRSDSCDACLTTQNTRSASPVKEKRSASQYCSARKLRSPLFSAWYPCTEHAQVQWPRAWLGAPRLHRDPCGTACGWGSNNRAEQYWSLSHSFP